MRLEDASRKLLVPETNLFYNAEVAAHRYPRKPFLIFYDTPITFARFMDEAQRLAGFLEQRCGVRRGDRVLLLMQNSPQFVIAYYGVLRANAIVVPINPMNVTAEVLRHVKDAGASIAIVAQELYSHVEPILDSRELKHAIIAGYSRLPGSAHHVGDARLCLRTADGGIEARCHLVERCACAWAIARTSDTWG